VMCMHLLKSLGMEVATEHKMTCLVELHRGEMNEAYMKADGNISQLKVANANKKVTMLSTNQRGNGKENKSKF